MTRIRSVHKAVGILRLFSPEEPRLALTEISRRLSLGKSTAHNLLNTLAQDGLVEKLDDGIYALGPDIIALTQAVRINVELRDLAAPLLRRLAENVKESIYLAAFDRVRVLYIYAIESSDRLRARSAVGDHALLHCTAVGKAILSTLPPESVDTIIAEVGLPRYTASTLTTSETLHGELTRIAQQGYATDQGEHEPNYYCVAAPIFDRRGQAIAACSLSGTNPAILGAQLADLSARVVHTAQEISRYMGYIPSRASARGVLLARNGHPVTVQSKS
ncbi:MAG: IclR family transcriptional regulator [Caldilineaceae bacterium]|nr:IclR family transcriptional regulator [Caldilineaceae bacterium]